MKRILIFAGIALIIILAAAAMRTNDKIKAPDFPGGMEWLNSAPLTLADLKGKLVLLDFWTYCCINCMHIIPDLKKLEMKYKDELVVIGVHSAKFENEQISGNIKAAILRYDIEHPVVNDKDFKIWSNFGVHAWPTLILIDPEGYVVGMTSGEGAYDAFDGLIASNITEFDARGQINRKPLKLDLAKNIMPSALLSFPGKIAADSGTGRLFFTDSGHNRIIIISEDGQIEQVIGSGNPGFKDGDFGSAEFQHPQGLCFDVVTNAIYVADTENHAIRKIDLSTEMVETLAGTGMQAGFMEGGGIGKKASLNSPWDLIKLGDLLYIAMAGSHQIWTLNLKTLRAEVFAGSGREDIIDGALQSAALAQPSGITSDGTKLYIADSEVSAIRQIGIGTGGKVETIIGQGLFEFGDIDGKYPRARLQHSIGAAFYDNNIYVADTYNHKIKRVDPQNKEATTFIGRGRPGMRDGEATEAELNEPNGLIFLHGKMYITDTNNHLIRVVDMTSKKVSTLELKGIEKMTDSGSEVFRGEEKELVSEEISVSAEKLRLKIGLPPGTKFTPGAPFKIEAKSDNSGTIMFSNGALKSPAGTVEIPFRAKAGNALVMIDMRLYYCAEGNYGQCFFKEARLKIPVRVTETGEKVLEASYQIPG